MLNTEGMSAAGLQRKATCQALFSKMLYLTEHEPLVAQGSDAFQATDLRTVRGLCMLWVCFACFACLCVFVFCVCARWMKYDVYAFPLPVDAANAKPPPLTIKHTTTNARHHRNRSSARPTRTPTACASCRSSRWTPSASTG